MARATLGAALTANSLKSNFHIFRQTPVGFVEADGHDVLVVGPTHGAALSEGVPAAAEHLGEDVRREAARESGIPALGRPELVVVLALLGV
jgi:hypothetical protein